MGDLPWIRCARHGCRVVPATVEVLGYLTVARTRLVLVRAVTWGSLPTPVEVRG